MVSLWHGTIHYAVQSCANFIQMRAIRQQCPVVLFILLHKEVLTFESVDGEVSSQTVAIQINGSQQFIL